MEAHGTQLVARALARRAAMNQEPPPVPTKVALGTATAASALSTIIITSHKAMMAVIVITNAPSISRAQVTTGSSSANTKVWIALTRAVGTSSCEKGAR